MGTFWKTCCKSRTFMERRMNSLAALRSALRALASNKLRSVLTMLGIIIGVGAVITMIAVGRGATERVQEQMKGLGSNIMLVLPGGITAGRRAPGRADRPGPDRGRRAGHCPRGARGAGGRARSRTGAQVVAGNTNWSTSILGTTNDYLEARDWPLARAAV
jgi:hypothetical protein